MCDVQLGYHPQLQHVLKVLHGEELVSEAGVLVLDAVHYCSAHEPNECGVQLYVQTFEPHDETVQTLGIIETGERPRDAPPPSLPCIIPSFVSRGRIPVHSGTSESHSGPF